MGLWFFTIIFLLQLLIMFMWIWLCGAGPHQITGNGVGFKPKILDMDVMEEVLEASNTIFILISYYMHYSKLRDCFGHYLKQSSECL